MYCPGRLVNRVMGGTLPIAECCRWTLLCLVKRPGGWRSARHGVFQGSGRAGGLGSA